MNITAIRTAAETIVAAELGASYKELPYQFDIETNDARSLAAGYSVVWGEGSQTFVIDQRVNIEQDIEVVITRRVFIRNDDDKIVTETDMIYSALDTIIKRFICDKLDIPDVVQEVRLSIIGKPERLGNGRDVVSIPLTFRVRYLID